MPFAIVIYVVALWSGFLLIRYTVNYSVRFHIFPEEMQPFVGRFPHVDLISTR